MTFGLFPLPSVDLKIVPKYEGKRKVIQHGANRARIPAKKEAVNEIPNKKLLSNISFYTKNQFLLIRVISRQIYFPLN